MALRQGKTRRRVRSIGIGRPTNLGLDERELDVVLNEFDDAEQPDVAGHRRGFVRWPFRLAKVPFYVRFRDGYESSFDVACRNLSSGGVSVLHRTFMHVGTQCAIELPHAKGVRRIEGEVVRCDHRQGMVHEVGVKFREPIAALEFVSPPEFTDRFSMERVQPELLHGTLVHVDASLIVQKVVKHFLRETQVRVRPASTSAEAEGLIREGCDLVLCDLHLPDGDGTALLEAMRAAGVQSAWIIVTSDTSDATRRLLESTSASAFLAKPLNQEMLLRAAGEFLMIGGDRSMSCSTLSPDDPAASLLDAYVKELRELGRGLENAMKGGDAAEVRRICLALKGNAGTFGFGVIGQLADEGLKAVMGSGSVAASTTELRAVVAACVRSRAA